MMYFCVIIYVFMFILAGMPLSNYYLLLCAEYIMLSMYEVLMP